MAAWLLLVGLAAAAAERRDAVSIQRAQDLCAQPDRRAASAIGLCDVEAAVLEWARSAEARDVNGTTALYDPAGGRLLGTVDEAADVRRNTPDAIRAYFAGFLGGHSRVAPRFPPFDPEDVIFLADDVASYSGYYHFELVKAGVTKKVHAKFTYILRKTAAGMRILTHNSGITPSGVVVTAQGEL